MLNFFINILRFIFSITFIISGFLKLSDPVGTQLIVQEYLRVLDLNYFSSLSLYIGMALSILEFITGFSVLFGIKYKFYVWVGLLLTAFFTGLTLYLALYNPITDCGCFGQAIHLTNWQTFYKNVVLMSAILLIFLARNRHEKISPNVYEWGMLGVFILLMLSYGIYNLNNAPVLDFGNFKVGTDIESRLQDAEENVAYETILKYSKNGVTKTFSMEHLPDDSWTFVDAETVLAQGTDEAVAFDFMVTDADGNDITSWILRPDKRMAILTYTDLSELCETDYCRIGQMYDALNKRNIGLFILTSSSPEKALSVADKRMMGAEHLGFADYKTIISMNRSNGGLVYLDDCVVVAKLSKQQISRGNLNKIITSDPDDLIIRDSIGQRLFYELAIIAILLLLWIMKTICRAIYVRKLINAIPKQEK